MFIDPYQRTSWHTDTLLGLAGFDATTLVAVLGLGAFHGINPGMGWLFAVSFGLQQRSARAVLRALVPIAIGHEMSVVPMALATIGFASVVTRAVVVGVFATALIGFGCYLLLRPRHFRWVGMKLNAWQLMWWSFLMSTATGAGLMLAPVLLRQSLGDPSSGGATATENALTRAVAGDLWFALTAALLHATAMALTAGVIALLVYRVIGLRILRTAWINMDRVWAFAFVGAGLFVWLG
ncbi:MAG: hypothetical protein ACRCYQ_15670 [Nocardioides sp.]